MCQCYWILGLLVRHHRCLRFPLEFILNYFISLAGLWRNLNCEQLLLLLLDAKGKCHRRLHGHEGRWRLVGKEFKKLFLEFFHCTRCFQDTTKSALHRHPKNLCVVCGSINEAAGFSCRATNRRNKRLEERSHAKVARELQVGSTTMRATPLENYWGTREKQQIAWCALMSLRYLRGGYSCF